MWLKLTLVSLKHIAVKIKDFYQGYVENIIWLVIFILALLDSFILGYLSNYNQSDELLKIVHDESFEITVDDLKKHSESSVGGEIVASKNGTKYYFPWCAGVNRIKEENKIYFSTEEQARGEGYDLAANCD